MGWQLHWGGEQVRLLSLCQISGREPTAWRTCSSSASEKLAAVIRLHTSSEMLWPCRHYFALFLWLETAAVAVSAAVAVARLRQSGRKFSEGNSAITWTAVFLVIDVFLLLSVGALSITQVRGLQMTCMVP